MNYKYKGNKDFIKNNLNIKISFICNFSYILVFFPNQNIKHRIIYAGTNRIPI